MKHKDQNKGWRETAQYIICALLFIFTTIAPGIRETCAQLIKLITS